MGKRLKELTQNNTKCMVKVNGVTLIERMLRQLDTLGLKRVVIVVGYEGQKLMDYIATLGIATPVQYINNPIYDKTNNIYSLALAKEELLEDDSLLLESDIIFEDSVLQTLLDDPRETLALVDKYESWMDGTCIQIGEDDSIDAFVPGKHFAFKDRSSYYKTVNIYKFSRHFSETHYVPFLEAYSKALGNNEYYEQVLRVITLLDEPVIKAKKLHGQLWYEIDDVQDLDIASSIFTSDAAQKVERIQARYGGYWRYPQLLDFCYLVNPYFPPKKLLKEMKASFTKLITQYPSGMAVNSLLASRNFAVQEAHILVGNGAAELIKALMARIEGKLGLLRPTFEEYPNRRHAGDCVVFRPKAPDFAYDVDSLMTYFTAHPVAALLIINPDNPTGHYIPRADMLRLADWCEGRHIRLILDESFVDFADETDASLICEEVLARCPSLVLLKSISKSYGVPGLRLGVLASADSALISELKKDVSIWNINAFAEFYMQIAIKYEKTYRQALEQFRRERRRFLRALDSFQQLRLLPTQANYVMAEIMGAMTARELTQSLLCQDQIFIKDLSAKMKESGGEYVRLAIRNHADNDRLLAALRSRLR